MSMTREEAIKHLLHDWHINLGCEFAIKPGRLDDFLAAMDVALTALSTLQAENKKLRAEVERVLNERDAARATLYWTGWCGQKED